MNIEIAVMDQRLTARSPRNPVAGTAGLTTFTAAFDESWAKLIKTLLFEAVGDNGKRRTVELLLEGSEGQVPWEVLEEPGTLRISAMGVSEDGIRRPTAVMAEPLRIIPSGAVAGCPGRAPTPMLGDQALLAAKKEADIAASAAASANQAAATANKAAKAVAGADKVNIRAEQTPTGVTITTTDRNGVENAVHFDTLTAVNTWADVRNAVRLGLGPKLFPVGYEFTTHDSDTGQDIIWVVRAHDHHTPASSRLTHSMTLELETVYSKADGVYRAINYTNQQALYHAPDGLTAGTYHFTVANQSDYPADNGKQFQFTLTKAIPAGGQICLHLTSTQTMAGQTVRIYSGPGSDTVLESATMSAGSAGTNLGTADGTGNMNHMSRVLGGSDNYGQSAIRQWLNSASGAGNVWVPKTKFDRPPAWAGTLNGFLHGLPSDFLSAVEAAVVPCRTNNKYECKSLSGTTYTKNTVYNLQDRFFLLSWAETYGMYQISSIRDGEVLDFYKSASNTDRIKRDLLGTARKANLRTGDLSTANVLFGIGTNGAYGTNRAYSNNIGACPACIIA